MNHVRPVKDFSTRSPGRHRNRTIEVLIVDDNPADSELLCRAIRDWKSESHLTVIDNGEEAISYVSGQGLYSATPRPDLILLDVDLPGKTGIEVLATLKGNPALQQIPIVMLSSSERKQDISDAYSLHANCYLTKTVDLYEFFAKIKALEEFWLGTVLLPSDNLS